MRTTKLLELAEKHHRYTSYETDVVGYECTDGKKNKPITKQHKVWAFTEDQLKKFVKDIEKESK